MFGKSPPSLEEQKGIKLKAKLKLFRKIDILTGNLTHVNQNLSNCAKLISELPTGQPPGPIDCSLKIAWTCLGSMKIIHNSAGNPRKIS